ncbi:MAG: SLBB domain-containing protein [Gemmatimonadales bacterium]|nr:SLBB domain-containing protein [Gemmatimonadales bacterium]
MLAIVFVCASAPDAHAQDPLGGQISPEAARELLRSRPDLQDQLRRKIEQSGLTPEQIRTRLRAAGFPESELDEYLTGSPTSTSGVTDGSEVDAARALGLVSDGEADTLKAARPRRGAMEEAEYDPFLRDSLRADSLHLPWKRPLQLFGLDVFKRRGNQFEATQSGPVDPSYRLGAGDRLALTLTGDIQRAYSLEVSRDGFVLVPQAGQLYVANLTLGQVEDLLYTRLGAVYSGVRRGPGATTQFQVTVTRLRNIQIFVAGDVLRPGAYQVSGTGTVLAALYAAGGPTANGNFRRIEIRRGGGLVDSLDLYGYLLNGVNRADVRLQSGDVIFVPIHGGRIKVSGEVQRPAIYEIKPTETLREALRNAGGFTPNALRQRVQIHRTLPAESRTDGRARVVVEVGPEQFAGGIIPAVPLFAGDSITVFSVPERVRSFVTVVGDVWVDGPVGWSPAMRLSDAIRLAGGVKPDVYLGQILVSRLRSDSTRMQLRTSFVDSTGRVADDLVLQEEDEIVIFSKTTFRAERYVAVTGAVRKPGRIRYREGMTVRDAILLADGLSEDAYLKEAEIARVPEDRSQGALATTIHVSLDSTYLFARGPAGEYVGPPGIAAPAAGAPEVTLQPYDNLLILRQPDWELPRIVRITGQVRYPGPYTLRTKTERLMDIIDRAGGLSKEAYPNGIEFFRMQDSAGRVGLDLPQVLRNRRHRDNIILAAGDSINIPEYEPVIMVRGAVNSPGAVAFRPGQSIDWYIRGAGGYTKDGDRNRAYVTQPNGRKEAVQRRFLLADSNPEPLPGAVVVVPPGGTAGQANNILAVLSTAAQLLTSLVTIIVVARR